MSAPRTVPELLAALAAWQQAMPPGRRFPAAPEELHLEVTWRCDARCVMCDVAQLRACPGGDGELSVDAYARLLADPLLDTVHTIVISGGEPTLRDDLADLVASLRARLPHAAIGMLTNLHTTERLARLLTVLRDAGHGDRLWLGSSLDGATAATHDTVRGVPGSFARVQQGIALVRDTFALPLALTFTLTEHNWRELRAAAQLAEAAGCGFGAQVAVPKPHRPAPRFTPDALAGIDAQVGEHLAALCARHDAFARWREPHRERHAGLWAQLAYWAELPARARGTGQRLPDCPAGSRYLMLDPQGRLSFCPLLKGRGVTAAPLSAMWHSPAAAAVRDDIIARRCPDCWLLCTSQVTLTRLFASPPPVQRRQPPRAFPAPAPRPEIRRVLLIRTGPLDRFAAAYGELVRVFPAAAFTLLTTPYFTAELASRYPAITCRLTHRRGLSLLRRLRALAMADFACVVVTGSALFPVIAARACRPRWLYRLLPGRHWRTVGFPPDAPHPLAQAADPATLPPLPPCRRRPSSPTSARPQAARLLLRGCWLVVRRWWLTRDGKH